MYNQRAAWVGVGAGGSAIGGWPHARAAPVTIAKPTSRGLTPSQHHAPRARAGLIQHAWGCMPHGRSKQGVRHPMAQCMPGGRIPESLHTCSGRLPGVCTRHRQLRELQMQGARAPASRAAAPCGAACARTSLPRAPLPRRGSLQRARALHAVQPVGTSRPACGAPHARWHQSTLQPAGTAARSAAACSGLRRCAHKVRLRSATSAGARATSAATLSEVM